MNNGGEIWNVESDREKLRERVGEREIIEGENQCFKNRIGHQIGEDI